MNNTKYIAVIAYCLMMSMMVHAMESEKSNELFISQDRIFMWTSKDRQYHKITELGQVSESTILEKNDQPHKIYRAQLVVKKKKENEEGEKFFLRTTQECAHYYTGDKFINLYKHQRILVPISLSQKQRDTMWRKYCYCWDNQKEAVLVMDNENNVYFITHVYDENRDNSKKNNVYDTNNFREVKVPFLTKKRMLLKIDALEKEVAQLKKNMSASHTYQPNSNALIAKTVRDVAFMVLVAGLLYMYQPFATFTH